MRKTSPCEGCTERAIGCHGKEDKKWKCKAWGKWKDAEAREHTLVIDPLNGYAAAQRRMKQHKKHMERRR